MGINSHNLPAIEIPSTCFLLALRQPKLTRIVPKYFSNVCKYSRQHSTPVILIIEHRILRPKEKWIFSSWMAMDVNNKKKSFFIGLFEFFHIVSNPYDLGEYKLCFICVNSVKIFSWETGSCVPDYDTIWVEHGNNFEDDFASEEFGLVCVFEQWFYETIYDMATMGLSRMHPSDHGYHILICWLLRILFFVILAITWRLPLLLSFTNCN